MLFYSLECALLLFIFFNFDGVFESLSWSRMKAEKNELSRISYISLNKPRGKIDEEYDLFDAVFCTPQLFEIKRTRTQSQTLKKIIKTNTERVKVNKSDIS